jgi:DNA mismatch repair protein MutL
LGRIRVLDDHLINRIAAGEVVERPASVVKELVENSLDAGAGSVEVRLEAGGKRSIRVHDDGEGMDRDDALLALERHATSKLRGMEDLEHIATLGFRGEALPSIAAVSRFVLRTARRDGEGIEIEVQGGTIRSVREVGAPRGTSITVERLFANVPARRKFLRTDATELQHVARLMTRIALAHPRLRVVLRHSGRRLIDAAPASRLEERVGQLYGTEMARKLLPFDRRVGGVRVHGFGGRPVDALPRRDAQHLFVNGRVVQDRVLSHAVSAAYGNTMPKGRFPALFLFVDVEPEQIDVNVHPQKTEVRFRRSSDVHDAVRLTLAGALGHVAAVPSLGELRPGVAGAAPAAEPGGWATSGAARALERFSEVHDSGSPAAGFRAAGASRPAATVAPPRRLDPLEPEGPRAQTLGQYRDSYIVAQDDQGLLLVDQHAAHERVLFEKYLAEAEENRVEVQRTMFPITVELGPDEALLLEQEASEFRRLGFMIEPFGGGSFRVDGVPAVAGKVDAEGLLRELLGEARQTPSATSGAGELRRRLVTSAACQAAIKINHPLTRDGMQHLLDDLYRAANPTTCPHGRPAIFRLTLDEIERAFRRR